jgi:hypothetical protein
VGKEVITNVDIDERCRMIAFLSNRENDSEFAGNIRPQVEQKLSDEAVLEQLAVHSKMSIDDEAIESSIESFALRADTTAAKLKDALKKNGLFETLIRLLRSNVISYYIFSGAPNKNLLRVSEGQIDDEVKRIKESEERLQYNVYEIAFFPSEKSASQTEEIANRTHSELVNMSKSGPAFNAFYTLARQLSQAQNARDGGLRGWVTEANLDQESCRAIKSLSVGEFSAPVKMKSGEFKIFFLRDLKKPGYAPQSEATVSLALAIIPFGNSLSDAQRSTVERRIAALLECSSQKEFEGVANDFGYECKKATVPMNLLPVQISEVPLNKCSPPIFTGARFEIYMPLSKFFPKTELKIDRDEIRSMLEDKKRSFYAEKVVKDFKSRLLFSSDTESHRK